MTFDPTFGAITKECSPANFAQRQWHPFQFNATTLTYLPEGSPCAPDPLVYVSLYGWSGAPLASPLVLNFFAWDFDNPVLEYAQTDTVNFLRMLMEVYDVSVEDVGIYFSGYKGFHVVLPADMFVGDAEIIGVHPTAVRGVALDLARGFASMDQSIYDVRRLFRVPGAQNAHSGLYKIPLRFSELVGLTASEIRTLATVQRQLLPYGLDGIEKNPALEEVFLRNLNLAAEAARPTSSSKHTTPLPELFMPARPGGRNNAAIQLTGILLGHIHDPQMLQQVMHMWNRTNTDPLPARELTTLVAGAFHRYTTTTPHTHTQRRSA